MQKGKILIQLILMQADIISLTKYLMARFIQWMLILLKTLEELTRLMHYYQLPEETFVNIAVYDFIGNKIEALVTNERQQAGKHEVVFDAKNLSEGIYLYKIKTADYEGTGKMVLMR
jgi:hypothetical protein